MRETEKFIDGLAAKTDGADLANLIGLIRRRIIEAIHFQFKEGLELSDIGSIIHPAAMINLIQNYNDQGEQVTQTPNPVQYGEKVK